MNKSTQRSAVIDSLCAEFDPEQDGIDPRVLARRYQAQTSRSGKNEQLAKNVQRILAQVLQAEIHDPLLQQIVIMAVAAEPRGAGLNVAVQLPAAMWAQHSDVLSRLQQLQGFLRSEIAHAVQRRKVPALRFELSAADVLQESEQEK